MTVPRWLSGLALVAVAVALVAVLLASVDLSAVVHLVLASSPWGLSALAIGSLLAWAWLPSWRWGAILSEMGHVIPITRLTVARMGAQPLKVIIPFRGGEAFRALWLRSAYQVPFASGLASVLFDLFLVALAQAVFLGIGLGLAQGGATVPVVPTLTVVFLVVALAARPIHRFGLAVLRRIRPTFADRVEPLVFGFLRFPMSRKLRLVAIALLVELCECLSLFACFLLVGADVPLAAVFTRIPFIVAATLIPVTIGGFGTRELAVVLLFRDYAPAEVLTGAAILFTFIEFVLPALLGLVATRRFTRELERPAP
jgi:uncharacterized protein (TIRG00374 family)